MITLISVKVANERPTKTKSSLNGIRFKFKIGLSQAIGVHLKKNVFACGIMLFNVNKNILHLICTVKRKQKQSFIQNHNN